MLIASAVSACGTSQPEEIESANLEPSGVEQAATNPPSDKPAASETTVVQPTATTEPLPTFPPLPVIGPAPDFQNDVWINSEPLNLADLEGKVVLLEFWTFGWINCKRVIPWVREWYDKYNGEEFTVVSIHYPEFGFEEDYDNVVQATKDLQVAYPVALDNDGLTWRAYQQRFWPTRYLIDKQGNLRYKHIGEGAYEETEIFIQQLIDEDL